jgi:hypothetical protein
MGFRDLPSFGKKKPCHHISHHRVFYNTNCWKCGTALVPLGDLKNKSRLRGELRSTTGLCKKCLKAATIPCNCGKRIRLVGIPAMTHFKDCLEKLSGSEWKKLIQSAKWEETK